MISDRDTSLKLSAQSGDNISFLQITELIANTLGIIIYPQHQDSLKKAILAYINVLDLSSFNDYYHVSCTADLTGD